MKVERIVAVAFLVSLGFKQAENWENDKIADRLRQVPERIDKSKVTDEGFLELYGNLAKLEAETELVVEGKAKAKPAASKEEGAKDGKGKPGAKKPAAPKKEKPAKVEAPKDGNGFRLGSIRAKVQGALSNEWRTEADIAKDAGVTVKQARIRLRRAKRGNLAEVERLIRYRLPEKGVKAVKK